MASTFPFTSRTIALLVEAIDKAYTNAQIGTLFLRCGADAWAPKEWPNKETRLQRLFTALRDKNSPDAMEASLELARLVMATGSPKARWGQAAEWWTALRDSLAADGLEYDAESERLLASMPGVSVADETSELEEQLKAAGWLTAAGHYRQARDGFSVGNWSSANAQLRNVLEDLLPSAGEALKGNRPKGFRASLEVLRQCDVLHDGEFDFLKGLWALCQQRGSHPGLSDEEEARFRFMTVTAYARFLLSRLPD